MTIHPFRPRTAGSRACADPASADIDDDFPYDFHEQFARATGHRIPALEPSWRRTRRIPSALTLTQLRSEASYVMVPWYSATSMPVRPIWS